MTGPQVFERGAAMDSGRCPVRHDFTMMDSGFLADPYAVFRDLRHKPVFLATELGGYVVTRYRDVDYVLSHPELFSNAITLTPLTKPSEAAQKILAEVDYYRPPNLINADAPRHPKIRRFVQEAMSPRRLRAMEPIVRDWARPRIEAMIEQGRADVFADLAFPLPAMTGFRLLGFPPEDLEMLKSWCEERVEFTYGRAKPEDHVRVAGQVAAFWSYMGEFVARRVAEPVDDLASDLARRHLAEPDDFTLRDVATVLFEMAVASHETTTNLLTNGLRRLLEHRGQWEAIVGDPSLIPNAVEECLRYDGSVVAWRRQARAEVEVGGVAIPAGATVFILLASANRDPDQFSEPERFDIRRRDARKHMTFGKGVHFCQGAPLARLEVRVVLELLAELAPGLTLVPNQEYHFVPNVVMRGPSSLLVEFARDPSPELDATTLEGTDAPMGRRYVRAGVARM
jgi:cytochrome P450